RDITSICLLHPLNEPRADVRIGRGEALVGIRIGRLYIDDGEDLASWHLLMPDGYARDSGVSQRGLVLIPASAPPALPSLPDEHPPSRARREWQTRSQS